MSGEPGFGHLGEHFRVLGVFISESAQIILHFLPGGSGGALPDGKGGAVAHVKAFFKGEILDWDDNTGLKFFRFEDGEELQIPKTNIQSAKLYID